MLTFIANTNQFGRVQGFPSLPFDKLGSTLEFSREPRQNDSKKTFHHHPGL